MITLISPYADITAYPVRILSAFLRSRGLKTRVIFLPNRDFEAKGQTLAYSDKVMEQIVRLCSGSSLIGLSLFTYDFHNAAYLTARLKERLKIPVIWGGKHPSAVPEECLACADIVCIGEGEEALAELSEKMETGKDYYDTANMWFKHGGRIRKNPLRPLNEDLDGIPFADYSFDEHYVRDNNSDTIINLTPETFKRYTGLEGATRLVPYETLFSRGCPYSCSYCYSYRGMYPGQQYLRFRSVGNIMRELEAARKQFDFIQLIWFLDDNIIGLPAERISEFCRAYKERIGLPMAFAGHPNNVNEEKLALLVDAGLIRLHVGIQTGSKRTQRLYKRVVAEETTLKAVAAINKFKGALSASYDVIIDNPYENNADMAETIRLLLKFPRPRQIKAFSLTLFPGTELYEKAKSEGRLSADEYAGGRKKHYLSFYSRQRRFLNLVFPLLNLGIPAFVIRVLINKYVLYFFDRRWVNNSIFNLALWLKKNKEKIGRYENITDAVISG